MNTLSIIQSVLGFLKSISESSLTYCPETFSYCPYPVFCINSSLEILYRNQLSEELYGEGSSLKDLFEKVTFERPLQEKGLSTGRIYKRSTPREWIVSFSGDQWILIVIVPGKMDIERFKNWEDFMTQPLHGTSPLVQKIQEVKLNLCKVQQRLEIFKRSTDLQIQYQQYLMEEQHVL